MPSPTRHARRPTMLAETADSRLPQCKFAPGLAQESLVFRLWGWRTLESDYVRPFIPAVMPPITTRIWLRRSTSILEPFNR